jgi:3-hydroxyisobutyrate dehydrogenase-like beta-hydroxyacid dehydrogenase
MRTFSSIDKEGVGLAACPTSRKPQVATPHGHGKATTEGVRAMKTLGFIGTGGMGSGMAANLIKAGYRLVVSDLRREQAKGLEGQGAQFADSPKAVAESCELVLSMLPTNDAVKAVALGKGGLVEATKGAKVWIDFSSIDKETIVGASADLGKKGWTVVDASAGGVEEVAAAGQLALWLSGSKALFDEHQPIFKAMGKSILHVGELGNAKLVKNAMAMLAAVQHMSFVEVCRWLGKGGLDAATFQTVIKNSQQDSVGAKRRELRPRYGARDGGPDAVCRPRSTDVRDRTSDGPGRLRGDRDRLQRLRRAQRHEIQVELNHRAVFDRMARCNNPTP